MGSLGLPATAMAVRSAFALLCFALLCGLAASSVVQSETETELKEDEAAGNKILVEQALESRVARGINGQRKACKNDPKSEKCKKLKKRNNRKGRKSDKRNKNKTGKSKNKNKPKDKAKGKGKRKNKAKGQGKRNNKRNGGKKTEKINKPKQKKVAKLL